LPRSSRGGRPSRAACTVRSTATSGLRILAGAAADDLAWGRALARLDLSGPNDARACKALRTLLGQHDGAAVAQLAGQVF
jgi:hypothetical protein